MTTLDATLQQESVEQIYFNAAAAGARPDPNLKVSDWADQYRTLTTRSSPEPGPWRTSRTPYLRDVMDALSPGSPWEIVVWQKGHQIGATECANNWVGFNIHLAPGPMMLVMPTTQMAIRNSKQRIAPLIQSCAVLRDRVREPRSKDSSNTQLAKEFPGGILVMTGANSAKGLRSMSARYLVADEVDAYPGDIDNEGDPLELAIARTSNYARRKIFIISTPTIAGRSRVSRYYEEHSDQGEYWVPCPFCAEMQVLRFENLRWPKGQPEAAHMMCVACGRAMANHAKNFMLPRGEWRFKAIGDGKTKGFYLSSLYSPVGWRSWGEIAAKYDAAGEDVSKLQVFWNIELGLPWADIGEAPDSDRLYERREHYQIGKVPKGGLLLTAGADVQKNRIEVEIVAWGRRKQSWSVDYRVFEGDTAQPEVWDKLTQMLDEEFPTVYGEALRIQRLAVDTGFNTSSVYDWVRKMTASRVIGIKGRATGSALIGQPSLIETGPNGRRLVRGIRLWPINTSIAKEQLYRWLKLSVPDLEKGEAYPTGFAHFPEYSKEYFLQLCAEKLVTKTIGYFRRTEWQLMRDRNEALDCRIYATAAASSLRFEVWADSKWDEIERSLTSAGSDVASAFRPHTTLPPTYAPATKPTPEAAQLRTPTFRAYRPKEDE